MTKIDGRTKQEAAKQIEESLKRLQTDHIDLMQHHEVIRMEDPDRIFAEGGAQEALVQAKKAEDPVRRIHRAQGSRRASSDARGGRQTSISIRRGADAAQCHGCALSRRHHVLPALVKEHIGVLGMKSMAGNHILKIGTVTAVECLHYAMTLPTSVVITGIESRAILDQALEAVRSFKPMTTSQITALLNRTAVAAADGRYEPFKTTGEVRRDRPIPAMAWVKGRAIPRKLRRSFLDQLDRESLTFLRDFRLDSIAGIRSSGDFGLARELQLDLLAPGVVMV